MRDVKIGKVLFMDQKYGEALSFFREGAAEGCAECAFNYAYMKLHGYGCSVDPSEARSFFALASGIIGEACYNLAVMYMHGSGCSRDYRKSYEYMRDAAEKGVIEARLYLGSAHIIGYLIEPNIVSISLIPYHTPEYREQNMMLEGDVPDLEDDEQRRIRAVRMDHKASFEWFREAARQSPTYVEDLSKDAKYLYARCFLDGVGVDFNRDKANALMLLAAADGSAEARAYLETDAPYVLSALENKKLVEKIRREARLAPPG